MSESEKFDTFFSPKLNPTTQKYSYLTNRDPKKFTFGFNTRTIRYCVIESTFTAQELSDKITKKFVGVLGEITSKTSIKF
jgi:hypothetical protein